MHAENQNAQTLSLVSQAIKVSHHGGNTLARLSKVIREHFQAETCLIFEISRGRFSLISSDGANLASLDQLHSDFHERLLELVVKKNGIVLSREDGFFPPDDAWREKPDKGPYHYASVPMLYRDEMVGALTLQMKQSEVFTLQKGRFLEFIALQLAGVIQNLATMERAKKQLKKSQNQKIIRGIGVSPGLGIGSGFLFHPGILSVDQLNDKSIVFDFNQEQEKLRAALETASADLYFLEKKLAKDLAKSESDIFQSHRMILSDPDFLHRLEGEIHRGKTALEAISWVLEGYMNQLREAGGPRFEEAVVDLEELRQRTLEKLLKFNFPGEKEEWSGILVTHSLGPSDTLRLNPRRLLGIATLTGGLTSHAAILARSLGIPAVMGAPGLMESVHVGDLLIVDGDKGEVLINPDTSVLEAYELREKKQLERIIDFDTIAYQPTMTEDGHRLSLEANVGFTSDLKKLRLCGAEGVGLFRTEYLFMDRKKLPNEQEQFEIYRQTVIDAEGLPLTFRVLDAGGDKCVEALNLPKESNPFLGCRSLRLLLSRPEILKTQLRALLRASVFGTIRLLLPMVSGVEEIESVKKIIVDIEKEFSRENVAYDPRIPLGIMIEIPSAVQLAHLLVQKVDFMSIGSNDLIQYTLAVDRNNETVAKFFESLHPGVLSSIAHVASVGLKARKPVAICGEMASDPMIIPLLVGMGITSLSMIPTSILMTRRIIRELNFKKIREMTEKALRASTVAEVQTILQDIHHGSQLEGNSIFRFN